VRRSYSLRMAVPVNDSCIKMSTAAKEGNGGAAMLPVQRKRPVRLLSNVQPEKFDRGKPRSAAQSLMPLSGLCTANW
jgi:hypothetical protein